MIFDLLRVMDINNLIIYYIIIFIYLINNLLFNIFMRYNYIY